MKALSALVLFLAIANTATGQATKYHVTEPMKALNFLVGKWEGKVKYESGQHQEVSWTAHVYYNVGGNMLLIDERGSEIGNKNNTTKEVFVVVYWDAAAKQYLAQLCSTSKDGAGSSVAKGHVQGDTLVLQTNEPGPVYRWTVRRDEKGQWHEIGEFSDGKGESWKRRFEMKLKRQD